MEGKRFFGVSVRTESPCGRALLCCWAMSLECSVCPAQAEPFVSALGETINPTLNFLSFEA